MSGVTGTPPGARAPHTPDAAPPLSPAGTPEVPPPSRVVLRRTLAAVLLLVAVGIFVFHARIYWQWTEDDAFITYRYAQNVARGEGFVFNPGERIEGYSNFTWVLLAAAAERAGRSPEQVAKWFGLAAGVAALLLSWALTRRLWPQSGLGVLLAPYFMAISPLLVQHSVAGLETSFFAALLTAAVFLAAGRRRSAMWRSMGLVLVLMGLALTRPEGGLVAFLLLGLRGVLVVRRDAHERRWLWRTTAVFTVLFALYCAWRWSYFHALLPNTYYAKARGGLYGIFDGVQYALDFLRDNGGPLFMALALLPALLGTAGPWVWTSLGVVGAYLVFIVLAGGDWMFHYRFFVHMLPTLIALVAVGWAQLLALPRPGTLRAVSLYAAAAAVLATTFVGMGNTELRVARAVLPALASHNYLSQNYEELGLWFAENTPPEATIAISDVGAVGYFSQRRVLDMFGLIDPHIARLPGRMHYKADPKYVLARQPDYIVLVSLSDQGAGYSFLRIPDYTMNAQPAFHEQYELIRTVPQHWNSEFVLVYRRRGA